MKKIIEIIKNSAGSQQVYIVGGWLRDKLLKRENRDLDIVTVQNPVKTAKKIASILKGSFVVLDKENKIYRIVLKNNPELDYIDFSKMKGPDIISDLKKRDFTINSFAMPLGEKIEKSEIIDPVRGLKDLKAKTIRLTGKNAFHDDPLRILRAFRISSELGFKISADTLSRIRKEAHLIKKSAWERIRDEFFKLLSSSDAYSEISRLEKTGILDILFPEILIMKRSGRKFYYHPKGLWQHSTVTLKSFEELLNNIDKNFPGRGEKILKHLKEPLSAGVDRENLIKFIALFHDVAKPLCAKKCGSKMRFLGHEEKGAAIVSDILKRLRVGSSDIRIAKTLVNYHMRPISLTQAAKLTPRATFRFFRDLGENVLDILLLALSDWHSYKGLKAHKPAMLKIQEAALKEIVRRYFEEKEKPEMPKIIDGNILMNRLGLKPGPIIGKILNKIKEAQFTGKVHTTDEAIALAKKTIK